MTTPVAANSLLVAAKSAKKDEFYTQWVDIEREINAYLEYDPDVFRDQVVLLPCDDPEYSNFTKFFALNFADLGLKKLISTSYAPDSNPAGEFLQPTLFEVEDPKFDAAKTRVLGKKFVLERKDVNGDGVVNIHDLQWEYLKGDGDFRSREVTALRDEADIVITNPPFSLFRGFLAWLVDGDVKFSVIGNMNAITYNDVFPLFKSNQAWYGPSISSGDREFGIPSHYPLDAVGARVDENGRKFVRIKGVRWFTNIDHGRRHEPLQLMSKADNLRFNKKLIKALAGAVDYLKYDTYDAIEIPFTSAIPSDYEGVMGVPITFLDRYNPEQFEILFNTEDMAQTEAHGVEPLGEKRVADYYAAGGTAANSPGRRKLFLYHPRPYVPFKRIAIRHRTAQS
ncbi:Site-specific DNA-methyltransferase (Adenine-specific) [Rhodococcus sp. AW25M09]|uniref:adenine-specific methyltransferase EcoRI family protein n=1 Tax=Rhodococcus sp. AW25M09 TaxID=1268303 RepID=UPI0002AC1340|nr:adenine-specific methyltransferase EcoRI family protein [Rhodococcus sp. AW25M09]CCQ17542.1 Site-specific DNA-methyltransferase (Adenine-specific) [Rhodococcus sp. AW25M09]